MLFYLNLNVLQLELEICTFFVAAFDKETQKYIDSLCMIS